MATLTERSREIYDIVQRGLDQRAIRVPTLSTSELNELHEIIDDRVAALLVAGSGITITYNDTAGTITITKI